MLIEVAFASDKDAQKALSVLESRPDLVHAAYACQPMSDTEVAVVRLEVPARHRTRAITLMCGLHGILVKSFARSRRRRLRVPRASHIRAPRLGAVAR